MKISDEATGTAKVVEVFFRFVQSLTFFPKRILRRHVMLRVVLEFFTERNRREGRNLVAPRDELTNKDFEHKEVTGSRKRKQKQDSIGVACGEQQQRNNPQEFLFKKIK